MLLDDQAVGVELVPLKVIAPGEFPKLEPLTTMEDPIAPLLGVRLVIEGAGNGRGTVICESKFPFAVPSISNSPLKEFDEVPVRLTPTHK